MEERDYQVDIDLTEKGGGLGIEAGYAYAREIPIITIAKSGSDISKEIFFYNSIEDLGIPYKNL